MITCRMICDAAANYRPLDYEGSANVRRRLQMAFDELKAGASYNEVSQKYSIPKETVRRKFYRHLSLTEEKQVICEKSAKTSLKFVTDEQNICPIESRFNCSSTSVNIPTSADTANQYESLLTSDDFETVSQSSLPETISETSEHLAKWQQLQSTYNILTAQENIIQPTLYSNNNSETVQRGADYSNCEFHANQVDTVLIPPHNDTDGGKDFETTRQIDNFNAAQNDACMQQVNIFDDLRISHDDLAAFLQDIISSDGGSEVEAALRDLLESENGFDATQYDDFLLSNSNSDQSEQRDQSPDVAQQFVGLLPCQANIYHNPVQLSGTNLTSFHSVSEFKIAQQHMFNTRGDLKNVQGNQISKSSRIGNVTMADHRDISHSGTNFATVDEDALQSNNGPDTFQNDVLLLPFPNTDVEDIHNDANLNFLYSIGDLKLGHQNIDLAVPDGSNGFETVQQNSDSLHFESDDESEISLHNVSPMFLNISDPELSLYLPNEDDSLGLNDYNSTDTRNFS